MDWISLYDFKHSMIYVDGHHRDVHYRTIAGDIRRLVPAPTAAVLDYGCGEATSADVLAAARGHLTMVVAAPNVRAAGGPTLAIRKFRCSPDEASALPASSLDLVVLYSVAQYLTSAEFNRRLLAIFRKQLNAEVLIGVLALADIRRHLEENVGLSHYDRRPRWPDLRPRDIWPDARAAYRPQSVAYELPRAAGIMNDQLQTPATGLPY